MFTRNFYLALATELLQDNGRIIKGTNVEGTLTGIHQSAGDIVFFGEDKASHNIPSMYHPITSYTGNGGVIFGTGNTAPSYGDYALSGAVVSGITVTANVTPDPANLAITGVYTIVNNNTDPVTIGEIGLLSSSTNMSAYERTNRLLVEHTALDSPITIPAGGMGRVTYTISLNVPTA